MNQSELQNHVLATYTRLRVGMGLLALAFAPVLWAGGLTFDIELQRSMSVYYHTPMRNAFVGILFAIGAFLFLYKGFSRAEDRAYNLAGLLALGIVFFPIDIPPELEGLSPDAFTNRTVHLVAAVGFFLSMAYACLFTTRNLPKDMEMSTPKRFNLAYRFVGTSLVVLPLLAVVCGVLQPDDATVMNDASPEDMNISTLVFFIEAAAVTVFGFYWILQSLEIRQLRLDEWAIKG